MSSDGDAWHVCWLTMRPTADDAAKVGPGRILSQFPGLRVLAFKDELHDYMSQISPACAFVPETFCLPRDSAIAKDRLASASGDMFLFKPSSTSGGSRICFVNSVESLCELLRKERGRPCVLQRYIPSPYLIAGVKFDLRMYA